MAAEVNDKVEAAGRLVPTFSAPAEVGARWDLMYDILRLAFQSDQTLIATLLLANDGSNIPYA